MDPGRAMAVETKVRVVERTENFILLCVVWWPTVEVSMGYGE